MLSRLTLVVTLPGAGTAATGNAQLCKPQKRARMERCPCWRLPSTASALGPCLCNIELAVAAKALTGRGQQGVVPIQPPPNLPAWLSCPSALLRRYGTLVAAKILKGSNEIALGDFRGEIEILRRVHHPNAVQVRSSQAYRAGGG